jgi:hypothetical protein
MDKKDNKISLVKVDKEQFRKIRAFAALKTIGASKLVYEIFDEWLKKHEGTVIK